jgi:choline-glycine betaine transporter
MENLLALDVTRDSADAILRMSLNVAKELNEAEYQESKRAWLVGAIAAVLVLASAIAAIWKWVSPADIPFHLIQLVLVAVFLTVFGGIEILRRRHARQQLRNEQHALKIYMDVVHSLPKQDIRTD